MSRIERIEGFRLSAPIDPPRAFSPRLAWLPWDRNELLLLEYPALVDPVRMQIVRSPLVLTDGLVHVPGSAGLGVNVDDAALERLATERFAMT